MQEEAAAESSKHRGKSSPPPSSSKKRKSAAVDEEDEAEAKPSRKRQARRRKNKGKGKAVEEDESEEEEAPAKTKKQGKRKAEVEILSGEEAEKVVIKRDRRHGKGGEAGATKKEESPPDQEDGIIAISCGRCARHGIRCKPRPNSKGRHGKKACEGCRDSKVWCSLDAEGMNTDTVSGETPVTILARMAPPPPPSPPTRPMMLTKSSQDAAKARNLLRTQYNAAVAAAAAYTAALLPQTAVASTSTTTSHAPVVDASTATIAALNERIAQLEAGQAGLIAALESLRKAIVESRIRASVEAPRSPPRQAENAAATPPRDVPIHGILPGSSEGASASVNNSERIGTTPSIPPSSPRTTADDSQNNDAAVLGGETGDDRSVDSAAAVEAQVGGLDDAPAVGGPHAAAVEVEMAGSPPADDNTAV